MVAQEGKVAGEDGFLVVGVGNLVLELGLAFVHQGALLDAVIVLAVEFGLEGGEHVADIVLYGDKFLTSFHFHKLEGKGGGFYGAVREGHFKRLFLYNLLEPLGIGLLLGVHINADIQRAAEFALHAENLLAGEAKLHAEVVEVHLVRHGFRADGYLLHLGDA